MVCIYNITIWHNGYVSIKIFLQPHSIANILALVGVTSKFRVTMDTHNEPDMFVYTSPNSVLNLDQCCEEFYYFYNSAPDAFNPSIKACSLLTTVQENNIYFHRSENEGEVADIIIKLSIRFPPITKFKRIVKVNQLENCSITVSDIYRADSVYGNQVDIIKGKSVRKYPRHADNITKMPPPLPI